MQGEINKAEEILEYLKKIKPDINLVPYFLCTYYLSQIIYNTHKLEKALADGNRPNITLYRKQTLKAARVAIKTARKSAADLTESLKLMGTFFWILGKQRTALRWWEKSIKEGERLGARLELSRTFWEVSRRLSEENSRFSNLGGISGEQYKDRARSMFREMNLEWDLKKFDG
jgi:hypothetical protein